MPHTPRPRAQDEKYNVIGIRVKEARIALKLTHDALCAQIADTSDGRWSPQRRDIYKIEAGVRTCIDIEILLLAQALDCKPSWLLVGDGDNAE